jgi:hypothetical protein
MSSSEETGSVSVGRCAQARERSRAAGRADLALHRKSAIAFVALACITARSIGFLCASPAVLLTTLRMGRAHAVCAATSASATTAPICDTQPAAATTPRALTSRCERAAVTIGQVP